MLNVISYFCGGLCTLCACYRAGTMIAYISRKPVENQWSVALTGGYDTKRPAFRPRDLYHVV